MNYDGTSDVAVHTLPEMRRQDQRVGGRLQALREKPEMSSAAIDTAKQKVLKKYPKAYVKYAGLSLKFVVVADHRGPELSAYRLRERDAWADAVRRVIEEAKNG